MAHMKILYMELLITWKKTGQNFLEAVEGEKCFGNITAEEKIILEYLDKNPSASTSDVIAFIASQPDFHEYSAVKNNIK